MKLYFASDHAGFELKNALLTYVHDDLGFDVEDCGPETYDEHDDYPELIARAAKALTDNDEDRAIILGGSGQGEAMVANRFKGIRATVYYGGPTEIITLSREHNNANVLSLGARFLSRTEAKEAVALWLAAAFTNEERHTRRIAAIDSF